MKRKVLRPLIIILGLTLLLSADLFLPYSWAYVLGDVSGDDEVSAYDAALAAHIAVGLSHSGILNSAAAEVSGDGEITAYDAALIAQKAVGIIESFPISAQCGDGACNGTETCSTCAIDCGTCPVTEGLVSYWKLDSQAGGITPDEEGANNGKLIGDASIITDPERGSVLSLDGTGDYVEIIENTSLAFTNNFTASAWIYKKDSTMDYIFSRTYGAMRDGWQLYWNVSKFRVDGSFGGISTIYNGIGSGLELNKWQHVAISLDSSNIFSFYIDGKLIATRAADGPVDYLGTHRFFIGGGTWSGALFNGLIDDVMIYHRVLSDHEIQQIHDSQAGIVWPPASSTYYVSNEGSDTNPGTLIQPLKTIQKARDTIRWHNLKGVTVYIRGGAYYFDKQLEFTQQDSGSAGNPNIYVSYPGEEAVLKGSKRIPVSEFSAYSENILKADLSAYGINEFYQMFMNSKRLIPARYPNYNESDAIRGGWLFAAEGSNSTNIFYNEGEIDPTGWDVEDAWVDIFAGLNYGNGIIKLNSIDPLNRSLSVSSSGVKPGNRYYIAHVFEELDDKNEWYYDNNTKILYLYPEHTLTENDEITIPVAYNVVSFNGADYINFKGISVEESWARGIQPLYTYDKGNCFYIYDSEFITIDDCKISNSGTRGIFVGDSLNVTVKNSEISNTGREAIHAEDNTDYFKQLINTGYLFTNNTIHDTNELEIIWSGAIRSKTVGSVYSYNHFYDLPRIAVLLYGSNDNIVEYNYVHNVNLETEDTGSLYFVPFECTNRGNVFRYNYINGSGGLCQYNNKLYYPCYSYGIYLDNAGSGTLVYGNTIIDSTNAGVFVNGGRDNIIENNTIVENMNGAQISFGGARGDSTQWWNHLQNLAANGYNATLYYQKYPELYTIQESMTEDEEIGYTKIKNNIFIYPESNTYLYSAGPLDLNTSEFNNNIIWQGLDPVSISVKGLSWKQWKALGFDVNSLSGNDVFETSPYNEGFDDDYTLLVNTEKQNKDFYLGQSMCDFDNNVVDSVTLAPFESRVLLNCFCNSDNVCNNRETISTCPGDCTATCSDGIKNQDETDVDCGGITCSACDLGKSCSVNLDCLSNNCINNTCTASTFATDYVSYWKLDTQTSGITPDEARNNRGTLIDNATIITDAERGNVLSLDGDGDYVNVNDADSLDVSEITFLAWVYLKDAEYDAIIEKGESSGLGWAFYWNGNNRLRVNANLGGVWYGSIQQACADLRNQWHQVGWRLQSPGQLSFLLDGNILPTLSVNGTLSPTVYNLRIGGPNFLNGMIDDVMIYDRALSAAEIQQIYEGQD